MQDKHIDEMVRRWFGEPVIAVEDEIKALITTEQLAIWNKALELVDGVKAFERSKKPKPILRAVEEGFGFGDVRGVVSTTEDTGFTHTEQDEENAAFETAQPYLAELRSAIQAEIDKIGGEE